MSDRSSEREAIGDVPNPLGLAGIEYIEYSTTQPQALGQVLEQLGFKPVARHRSREVLLYRQGGMNLVVNAHGGVVRGTAATDPTAPRLSALGLRVRDAKSAYERALELGGWDVPNHAQAMELNIPGIHGPGGARLYFVDRWREFSIFDIDFRPIPGVDPRPPAQAAGIHFFGIVQYIGRDRTDDWAEFYGRLFGFTRLAPDTRFGILPEGAILKSPGDGAGRLYLQLIEPHPTTLVYDEEELWRRIAFGTADVSAAVAWLRRQGVEFVEGAGVNVTPHGAITRNLLQSVEFELVLDPR